MVLGQEEDTGYGPTHLPGRPEGRGACAAVGYSLNPLRTHYTGV